jgi:hypothetical protein
VGWDDRRSWSTSCPSPATTAGAAFIAVLTLAAPAGAAPQPHSKATGAAAHRSAAITARLGHINGESVDRDHSNPIEILSFPALDGSANE